jgi:O-antigen ligase
VNSFGLRYVWWHGGFEIWKDSPWIGYGGGSTFKQFARIESKIPTELGADVEGFITPEPHSSILATAIEQGLLGIVLMASFGLMACIHSIRYAYKNPSIVGLSAAWFIVIVFSLAHTIQFSSYASTLVVILTALTLGLTQKKQIAP